MSDLSFKRTRLACYSSYFTMSSVFCVPPLLFSTFREMYGISYTLLGTLVLINFCTQLTVDLVFTAFSAHFDTKRTVRVMPLFTACGLALYALLPLFFPQLAYLGLALGTVIFSVAAGLSEVLLSPIIAAIPSDDPQREMSFLHSLYAFGVLTMILLSTVFFTCFGRENWTYLMLVLAALPLISAALFMLSPMPDMDTAPVTATDVGDRGKRMRGLTLCVLCIFFGSCAENVMSNWISSYMETSLGVAKALGDVLGVSLFAVLLGVARIAYAKFGKSIFRVLLIGMLGSALCYLAVAFSPSVPLAFAACIAAGLFVSMLWPGTLIMMEEKIPHVGVAAYALMAASGDLGASFAPQLMGVVIDKVSVSALAASLGDTLGLAAEQVGLRAGMLATAIFPLLGALVTVVAIRYFKKDTAGKKCE